MAKEEIKKLDRLEKQVEEIKELLIEAKLVESKEKFVPKDGDFVYLKTETGGEYLSIYEKEKHYYVLLRCAINSIIIKHIGVKSLSEFALVRSTTEEEKQILVDKMKEDGYSWNAEEKKVEKVEKVVGGSYFLRFNDCVGQLSDIEVCDYLYFCSDDLNAFETQEEAEAFRNKVWELFKSRKEL